MVGLGGDMREHCIRDTASEFLCSLSGYDADPPPPDDNLYPA